jgi:hypothetical protein
VALALVAFLVLGTWATGQTPAPRPCCSRCEQCVSSVCQAAPAKTPLKTELAGSLEAAAPLFVLARPATARLTPTAHRANQFVLPGFDPPLRN